MICSVDVCIFPNSELIITAIIRLSSAWFWHLRCRVFLWLERQGRAQKPCYSHMSEPLQPCFPFKKPILKTPPPPAEIPRYFNAISGKKNTIPDFLFLSRLFSNNENALLILVRLQATVSCPPIKTPKATYPLSSLQQNLHRQKAPQ